MLLGYMQRKQKISCRVSMNTAKQKYQWDSQIFRLELIVAIQEKKWIET